jgi:hypothetical protein
MSIFQELQNRKVVKTHEQQMNAAVQMFEEQKRAIMDISGTAGFDEIMSFLERGIEISDNTLDKLEGSAWHRVKGECDSYRKLRRFLKNLIKRPEIPDESNQ